MIRKIDSNKFSLTILKVTTFSRIRHVDAQRFDDAILAEYGNLLIMAHPTLFGLNNKNLLKSVTDSKGYTLSYTYELDGDGYPIKITETEKKNQYDSGSPEVYTLTWE